jgi:hypothetical protein
MGWMRQMLKMGKTNFILRTIYNVKESIDIRILK